MADDRRPRRPPLRLLLLALLGTAACHTVHEPVLPPGWTAHDAERALSHADCVQLAIAWAPNALAFRARLQTAQAALNQAGTRPNPSLKIDWEDFGLFAPTPGVNLQQTLALGVVLQDLFARGRRQAAAQHDLEAALADVFTERRRLALDVCVAYDRLLAARAAVDQQQEALAVAERQRDAAMRMVAAGLAAPLVEDRAAADLAEAHGELAARTAEANSQEIGFAFALGFDRPVPLLLSEGLEVAPSTGGLTELLQQAATQRPELAAATARYQAQLERLHLLASPIRFLPGVGGGVRTEGTDTRGVASLDVTLPLFDTGTAALAAEDAGLLLAATAVRKAAQAVASEVALAHLRSRDTAALLQDHALPLVQRRQELQRRSLLLFEAGEIPFDGTLDAARDALRARAALVAAQLAAAEASWPLRIDAVLLAQTPIQP